jgi:hypothetical protein
MQKLVIKASPKLVESSPHPHIPFQIHFNITLSSTSCLQSGFFASEFLPYIPHTSHVYFYYLHVFKDNFLATNSRKGLSDPFVCLLRSQWLALLDQHIPWNGLPSSFFRLESNDWCSICWDNLIETFFSHTISSQNMFSNFTWNRSHYFYHTSSIPLFSYASFSNLFPVTTKKKLSCQTEERLFSALRTE